MPKYLALLGNTPELSRFELQHVLGDDVVVVGNLTREIQLQNNQQAVDLMEVLGGTSKILLHLASQDEASPEAVHKSVLELLIKISEANGNNIDFAVAEIGRDHLKPLDPAVLKRELKDLGIKSRYVENTRRGLSAASLHNNPDLIEIFCIQSESGLEIAQTVAVQDVDDWAMRDRQKPFAEHKRGLLPPKLARIMVNLALGPRSAIITTAAPKPTLLDPFCGAGTVLFEGLLMGTNVIGADIDQEAVDGTLKNLEWFDQAYPQVSLESASVVLADATTLQLPANSIDYIVTEPFLGKPKPQPDQLPNIYKGLERMYLGAFKQWRSFLKENAKLVVVFPQVELTDERGRTKTYSLDRLIDKLAQFGYTTTSDPVKYARPESLVQRIIYQFTYVSR
jgi:tRNA G10  N-methylase Trm11